MLATFFNFIQKALDSEVNLHRVVIAWISVQRTNFYAHNTS